MIYLQYIGILSIDENKGSPFLHKDQTVFHHVSTLTCAKSHLQWYKPGYRQAQKKKPGRKCGWNNSVLFKSVVFFSYSFDIFDQLLMWILIGFNDNGFIVIFFFFCGSMLEYLIDIWLIDIFVNISVICWMLIKIQTSFLPQRGKKSMLFFPQCKCVCRSLADQQYRIK